MSISVLRLDDRLVHGQVVVGWGNALGIDRIILVDDKVRETEWEQELYSMGVPESMRLSFASVQEGAELLPELAQSQEKAVVLVGDVDSLVRLCDNCDVVDSINVGGVHQAEGRSERLSYVFLSDAEFAALAGLSERSIEVTAQDVPSAKPVPIESLA